MNRCKFCGAKVRGKTHNCNVRGDILTVGDDDFLLSSAVAAATGEPILGYAAGQSVSGSIAGSLLHDNDQHGASSGHDNSDHSDSLFDD